MLFRLLDTKAFELTAIGAVEDKPFIIKFKSVDIAARIWILIPQDVVES